MTSHNQTGGFSVTLGAPPKRLEDPLTCALAELYPSESNEKVGDQMQDAPIENSAQAGNPDILSDCRVMLRFALREGLVLTEELRGDVACLDRALTSCGLAPLSGLPKELINNRPTVAVSQTTEEQSATDTAVSADGAENHPILARFQISSDELAIKVHMELSKVVAPATPLTLQISEPAPGKWRPFGGMPLLVKGAAYMALVFAFGFVLTALPVVSKKMNEVTKPAKQNSASTNAATGSNGANGNPIVDEAGAPSVSWLSMLNALCGAGLGATFYILLNTREHLVTRSYDPKYNSVYFVRLITGLIGGVILATTVGPMLTTKTEEASGFSFTPGVLAILGGFAAEAVQQILQRLVEVLLTVIRGDGSADAQARAKAAEVERSGQAAAKLLDYERETDPEKRKKLLDEVFLLFRKVET